MQQHLLSRIALRPAVEEYLRENTPLNVQFSLAFQNSTWYLTELGYKNEKRCNSALETIISGLLPTNQTLNFSRWDMEGIDLSEAKLVEANLTFSNLRDAKLHGTDLFNADLFQACLNGADLSLSNLRYARIENVDFSNANLIEADLRHAHLLKNANLFGARYCAVRSHRTIFPSNMPVEMDILREDLLYTAWVLFNAYTSIVDGIGAGSGIVVFLPDESIRNEGLDYLRVIEPFTTFAELEQYISMFLIDGAKEDVLEELRNWYIEKDDKLYCLQGGRGDSLGYIISGTEQLLDSTDDTFTFLCDLDFYGDIENNFIMKCVKQDDTWYISEIEVTPISCED